jgi:diguanylate cyclase (GGDEF)-like protein/PAS domain S-box-containing protein
MPKFIHWNSLRTRITVLTLFSALLGLVLVLLVTGRTLRQDLQHLLTEQQQAKVTLVAADVNDAIALRIKTLESLALLLQHGSAGQGVAQVLGQLERYPLTQDLFNEGLIVVDTQGRIQAEAPQRAHRVGRDVADTDYFKRAMQGTPHVGAPLVDPQSQHPFVVLAVPVRDSLGRVGGVLGGIINLQQPNFLSRLTERRFGLTGHTFVITPQNRTIVATSDKSRFMEVLPAPGVNAWIDLFMAGYEGSAVVTNPHGLEVLVTIKQVPIAGWYTSVILSTEEAFAPVNDARTRLLTVYLPLLVLLTSGLIWWVLRRQLAPLMDTTRTLTRLALSDTPVMPLPIQRVDEVGALIGGFNHLLQTLAQRQTALKESEARFKVLADNAPALVWMTGVDGRLNYFNKVWLDFTGRNLEQEVGGEWVQAIHPDDALHANQVYRLAYRAREPFHVDYRLRRGDGQYRWMAFNGVPRNDAQGVFAGFIGSGIDITERKLAEVRMQLMASVFTHAGEGILITDVEGTVVDVNDGFTRITGYTLADMQGQTTRLLQSGRHDPPFFQALWHTLQAQGQWRGEVWNRRKNGEVFPDLVTISTVKDTDGRVTHYVAFYSDITALKEHEAQLEQVAHFDSLTGLPNRLMLADRLKQVMPHTLRRSQRLAVVFIDLDGFKTVNDQYGHEAGDKVLQAVASRMKQSLREGDTLARLGGDEFVAVLLDVGDGQVIEPLLQRLLAAASLPIDLEGGQVAVSASLGVSFFPQAQPVEYHQLLRQADQAMYQAKLDGKAQFSIFSAPD